jgi:hypothetical protein
MSMPHFFYAPSSAEWVMTTITLHPADQQSVLPAFRCTPTLKEGSSEDRSYISFCLSCPAPPFYVVAPWYVSKYYLGPLLRFLGLAERVEATFVCRKLGRCVTSGFCPYRPYFYHRLRWLI